MRKTVSLVVFLLFIFMILAAPAIDYSTITPSNEVFTKNTSIKINFSITEDNLKSLTYSWNNNNYTLYNNSLVLFFNFDNVSSLGENTSTAFDLSNSQNNGTIDGPLFTTDGKYAGGMDFDGDEDYIDMGDIIFDGATKFSVAFWAKVNNLNGDNTFLSKGTFNVNVPVLFWRDEGTSAPCAAASDTVSFLVSTGSTDQRICAASGALNDNDWHFIVGTFQASSSTGLNLYIDGTKAATAQSTTSITSIESSNDPVRIGANSPLVATKYLDGTLDNYMIFNRTLTENEVYTLYASNLRKYDTNKWELYINQSQNATNLLEDGTYSYYAVATNTSDGGNASGERRITIDTVIPQINFITPTLSNATSTSNTSIIINISIVEENVDEIRYNWNGTNHTMYNNSLTLMFNFDNISALSENNTHIFDLSGNNNNGTAVGTASTTKEGKYSNAFTFDGNSDYVQVQTSSSLDALDSATITLWAKFDTCTSSTSGLEGLWTFVSTSTDRIHLKCATNDELRLYNDIDNIGTGTTSTSSPITTSKWHFIATTINASDHTWKVYVDGRAEPVINTNTGSKSFSDLDDGFNIQIGRKQFASAGYLNGEIDEFKIWDYAMDYDDIYQQYISNLNKFNQTQWYLYVNQSKNSTNTLTETDYTYFASARDSATNQNITNVRTVTISTESDTTFPKWENNKTNMTSSTLLGSSVYFNITLNESNPNQYIFSFYNGTEWINDTPTTYTDGEEIEIIKNTSITIGEINWTWYFNDTSNNKNQTDIFTININSADLDNDGIIDTSDPLLYNESNVTITGITLLNITIGGNKTSGQFSGTQDILFYDTTTLLINFSHNFSQSNLDLSNMTITLASDSILINFSEQIQGNKTVYFDDDSYISLCVKDAQISSINNITSACNGDNETDFTSCIGVDTGTTINGITCTDEGTRFKLEDLKHTGIKGTKASSSSSSSSSSGGGGGGGSSSSRKNTITIQKVECTQNSECSEEYTCYQNKCVKLFDAKILEVTSPIGDDGLLPFTYFMKGMANISGDVIVKFWLERNGTIVSSGQDTIYLGFFEEKTESTNIFVPKNIPAGQYDFFVEVGFENYQALAHRTVYVEKSAGMTQVVLQQPAPVKEDNSILFIIIIALTIALFVIYHKNEILQKKITKTMCKIRKKPVTIPRKKWERPQKEPIEEETEERKLVKGLLKAVMSKKPPWQKSD